MLYDNHGRIISYLRISVTDRCNFRCGYCLPDENAEFFGRSEILSFEEIARVARVGADLGLMKIRITGGEPTVRRDLPVLIEMLAEISGIRELAMTTNAARLEKLAAPLKRAGLQRVNISLDTLQPAKMRRITRRDSFAAVMRGILAAMDAGLTPLKFNAVVLRGTNDDELCDLADFALKKNAEMRFIEFMPMGNLTGERRKIVALPEMLATLNRKFDFKPTADHSANDPARLFVCRRTGARVGFITSMSDDFCGSCSRMRLTANGGLRPCLHQNAEVDVRQILRGGEADEQIADAFRRAANLKWAGHRMNDFVPLYSRKQMIAVGG